MRKLALVVALASTALATPAFARDNAWYVGVEGGAMLVEDTNIDIGTVNNAVRVNHKPGGDFDAIAGYDFGMFRIEGEVGYKQAYVDSFANTIATPSAAAGIYNGGNGKTRSLSGMLNVLADFGSDDGISGFVGGGAGYARVSAKNYSSYSNSAAFLDDSDSRFAWQAIAGVRGALTDNIDIGLKYRFFNVPKLRMTAFNGDDTRGKFRSHSLLGSLIFNFGAPTPPPPPPPPAPVEAPPPPPPAPEAPAQVVPGPFIVFFDWDKSVITPEAAAILDNAASAYATTGQASVMLAGHADKSGSDAYNVGLSQRRADAVKSYLASKSVPDTAITTEAFGESRPLVETADGVREPQNRRVEITFGPGSGQ